MSKKAVACNSKTTSRKLWLGLDWSICYGNARSNSELLTFDIETYFYIFLKFKL